jgi:hypothetical protein
MSRKRSTRNSDPAAGKAAVLGALTLLSASMGLLLNDGAKASDVTVNKAKTADKAFNAMDQYIRGRQVKKPSKPTDTAVPRPPRDTK